jgi:hypothetical protein
VEALFSVSACAARGKVRWVYTDQRYTNFDAVFFFCLLGFPLFPMRVAHVFRYKPAGLFERDFEWLPIRWSLDTLLLAWLRRASLALAIWAFPLALFAAAAVYAKDDPDGWVLLWLCCGAWGAFPVVWGGTWLLDARTRAMRRVFGDWKLGSCDPMTFRSSWIEESEFATSRPNYNADTWAEAAENCVRIHNWWGGLFAARMAQRWEDARAGKELVGRIMSDPEVVAGLAAVRKEQGRWNELLGPGRYGR